MGIKNFTWFPLPSRRGDRRSPSSYSDYEKILQKFVQCEEGDRRSPLRDDNGEVNRHNNLKLCWILCGLVLFSLLLLAGCASSPRKDGPPSYSVDVSKIPDAVPKTERLSKYGNMKTYVVKGKAYHVMQVRKKYVAIGVASWYGTLFHERKTSSGEKYDMLAMTAAHTTLPLPTYVQVTNLENGRRVIVKVNDRGPFRKDRLIDLSYVAAKKLNMLGRGTALVEVKAIDPSQQEPEHNSLLLASKKKRGYGMVAETASSATHEPVYLEVGKFRHKASAAALQHRVAKLTKNRVTVMLLTHHSRSFYLVQVGPIHDLATVDRISQRLRTIGVVGKKML